MEHIHTTYHIPWTTTKTKTKTQTNSVQKDKIKPYIQHLQYPYTSENTEIQLTLVDELGQDQTSLSPSVTSVLQYFISELNHPAHTEPCMDISSTFLKLPDPRFGITIWNYITLFSDLQLLTKSNIRTRLIRYW